MHENRCLWCHPEAVAARRHTRAKFNPAVRLLPAKHLRGAAIALLRWHLWGAAIALFRWYLRGAAIAVPSRQGVGATRKHALKQTHEGCDVHSR